MAEGFNPPPLFSLLNLQDYCCWERGSLGAAARRPQDRASYYRKTIGTYRFTRPIDRGRRDQVTVKAATK